MTWVNESLQGGITIWCYKCGHIWRNVASVRLWRDLKVCTHCGGYTDGVARQHGK